MDASLASMTDEELCAAYAEQRADDIADDIDGGELGGLGIGIENPHDTFAPSTFDPTQPDYWKRWHDVRRRALSKTLAAAGG